MSANDTALPAEHPDDDLLADLAAQTAEPDLAARVEAHVQRCEQCAGLLAEAEGMHAALRNLPPEPMPADVARRIDQALAIERIRLQSGGPAIGSPATSSPGTGFPVIDSPAGPPASPPNTGTPNTGELPSRRSLRAANANPDLGTGPITTGGSNPAPSTGSIPGSSPAPTTGSTRRIQIAGRSSATPVTGSTGRIDRLSRAATRQGARRQALEEQREDQRVDQRSRLVPMLRVAATVVVFLIVGAGAVKVVQSMGNDGTTTADSAASGSSAPPVLAPVLSTGTDYVKETLDTQVKSLVTKSRTAAMSAQSQEGATADRAASAPAAGAASTKAAASGDLLKSSTALRACLSAIGEPNAQPVAVDLARYGGRDAAILVLPAENGDYDVWVVGRDCAPQKDGTLDQVTIRP